MNEFKVNNELYYFLRNINYDNIHDLNRIKENCYTIIELLELKDYCNKIELNKDKLYFAYYSNFLKCIVINYDNILKKLYLINKDERFINLNLYRIILHEIKHVIQYENIEKKEGLYAIYDYEINNIKNKSIIKPSEINSDFESSLLILNILSKDDTNYIYQLSFFLNLINKIYFSNQNTLNFCKINNINFNIDCFSNYDIFVNGLYNNVNRSNLIKELNKIIKT